MLRGEDITDGVVAEAPRRVQQGDRDLLLLRCPEEGCRHLILKAVSTDAVLETRCPRCKTTAEWRLDGQKRPGYRVVERRV